MTLFFQSEICYYMVYIKGIRGLNLEKDMLSRFSIYNLDYINGAIIGEAYLTDCILVDQEFNEELKKINPIVYAKSNHTATYAWKLEKIKKYKHPIYMKGKLGLWNYEE